MNRCLLPTSVQLRARLYRPSPWAHSRLPHHGRSFAFAARLAKEHEESPEPERDEKKAVKKITKSKKEREEKHDNAEDGKNEAKDGKGKRGDVKKGKERKDGSKKENEPATYKERRTASRLRITKHNSNYDGGRNAIERSINRMRAKIEKIEQDNKDVLEAPRTVERSIARMRLQIEKIQQDNKDILEAPPSEGQTLESTGGTLKEALTGKRKERVKISNEEQIAKEFEMLDIKHLNPEELDFQPVHVDIPPVPKLAYGLDRVLFNPGIYRLQDPRTRVYNFDPYLEKIMSVDEFNFDALSEYKTSSKDEELLALTNRMGTKFTGSTSSMSGTLQHFHFLLSNFRPLNHEMLSRNFPTPSDRFSKITEGPSAIFLRWKDGIYAIDADKGYDQPNIMSWLGHSLEKLLTVDRKEFERYRRSSGDAAPGEDESSRCYHYSKLGNFLMRSQLDAYDPRLPGSGIFDLKTRAVVSIRMNYEEYETGKGYQIRYDQGEWESYEREFYDMTRATMLKYSLQVRMGRMDGIFVAYHNVDRIFGFQYLPLENMDQVLHGQKDTCLGDQEFKMSIRLLDELMQKATEMYPEQTLHLHFHTHRSRKGGAPFMYIFAEPVTEEQADAIQNKNQEAHRAFERDIVGIAKDDPVLQAEWQEIQNRVDEEVSQDEEVAEKGEDVVEKEEGVAEDTQSTDQESSAEQNDEALEETDEASEETGEVSEETGEVLEESGEVSEKNGKALEESGKTSKKGKKPEEPATPKGPLMGWTLAVRHRLNGHYVERPKELSPDDNWNIEYNIRELKEGDRWQLYEKVKQTRNKLIGEARESASQRDSLKAYREIIKGYSEQGRKWREEQDALAAKMETKVYEPLGPGSEAQDSS